MVDMKIKRVPTILFFIVWFLLSCGIVQGQDGKSRVITISYSGSNSRETITTEFADEWLLQPDDQLNMKLLQASFAMAAAGFRAKEFDISQRDHDILDFLTQAGFHDIQTDDYHVLTSRHTIGSAFGHKTIGDETLIAVSISGNNYTNEWLSNLTIDNDRRAAGFNSAANKVTVRLDQYIHDHHLSGNLRLWAAGFSRGAAVTNLFAADAIDSRKFTGVYAYTFAPPCTTKEDNADRYHSIFNIINPFDVVPIIPFPEWRFHRYGTDLYLPSIETDSNWNNKIMEVNQLALAGSGKMLMFNPQISRHLHTIFDYIAFFINSASSYQKNVQNLLLRFWTNKDPKTLLQDIRKEINFKSIWGKIVQGNANFRYRFHEFYNFIDYIIQLIYSSIIGNKFYKDKLLWDNNLSVQENIAYSHYDNSYRYWLYSTDDPDKVLSRNPTYVHYAIQGNVDVEIYDEKGNFVEQLDCEGNFSFDNKDSINPEFHGELSPVLLYGERQVNLTFIILPTDQRFSVFIRSNEEQDIRISYVQFSPNKLQGNVCYIYHDHYAKGETFEEKLDPEIDRNLTDEELVSMGVLVEEPWSKDITYSPTAVMRLENSRGFQPSPVVFLIIVLVASIVIIWIIITILSRIIKGIIRLIIRKKRRKKTPAGGDRLKQIETGVQNKVNEQTKADADRPE